MRQAKEEQSCNTDQAVDLISVVKELHGFTSQELNKLLRDSGNFIVQHLTEKGSYMQIDMEKLARFLPLHLVAMIISSERDTDLFRYLLCGLRLLYSLCSLAPRQQKLEQILLDDVKVSEQLLDLVLYFLIVLGGYRQENHVSGPVSLLHAALVSCSLHLLTECISTQWHDLVLVLLAHPKVDVFMDVAFGAVCVDVRFLQIKLSAQHTDSCTTSCHASEQIVSYLCQQCEASLTFLQSLCEQKLFRERLLRNKELCGKGGVLLLAQTILKLDVAQSFKESIAIMAAVSRLKSKVLSILLHLCEAESISYLDEVSSSPGSLALAKSVALEVLELLKTAVGKDLKHIHPSFDKAYPMGLLQLNAMRLVDIFSDDSNFRSYVTIYFTEFLTAIFSLPHGEFLSSWCSSNLPSREEDATLEFHPFAAAGWVLDWFLSSDVLNRTNIESTFTPNNMPRASYAHQRTSLLVKVIANLHCFVPNICEEQERNLFLHKFLECLQSEQPKSSAGLSSTSDAQKASAVCRNLRSLLGHAESLIPNFLNEEDVQLLRVFFTQIQPLISPAELEVNRDQEAQGSLEKKVSPDSKNRSNNLKEEISDNSAFQEMDDFYIEREHLDRSQGRNNKSKSGRAASGGFIEIETSGSDSSSTREKNSKNNLEKGGFSKSREYSKETGLSGTQEDEKIETALCEEKQRKKRKRTIMNDEQISVIERALLDEPDMQRNALSVQSWADKLCVHGSEVTSSQLRNWLNNRKARLARIAKDVNVHPQKEEGGLGVGSFYESPESTGEEIYAPSNTRGGTQPSAIGGSVPTAPANERSKAADLTRCEPGQDTVPPNRQREKIDTGNGAPDKR